MALLVLLISPFTESIGSFDNFPGQGQDFELSIFLVIALLCLVLLAAIFGKRVVDTLLHDREWSPHEFWEMVSSLFSCFVFRGVVWVPPRQSLAFGAFALPLRL